MKCCCIPSCPKPANLACYDIPTDVQRREQWLTSINNDHFVLTITNQEILSICSLHFKQSDYIYLFCDDQSSKRKIREDAVPSIFPWTGDWESNYTAEMEVAEQNGECSQQTDCSAIANTDLPEGEAVQLGNVESLGINTRISTEEETFKEDPPTYNDLNSVVDTGKLKNLLVTSIPSASFNHIMQLSTSTSNTNSRIESSEDEDIKIFNILPEKFQYSCTECEFKSPDIIYLKDHRMKNHPYGRSEPTSTNQTVNSYLGLSQYETPITQSHGSPNSSASSGSIVRYRDKSEKRRTIHSCTQCSYTTKTNSHTLQEHINKNHSNTAGHSESDRPSLSSASSSTMDCPHPSKRAVRKWYLCSECSFRTPNARKLKAHVRENHPNTPNSLDNEATKMKTSKLSETRTNEVRLNLDRSDLKRLRVNGQTYNLYPEENCSVQSKDSVRVLRHHQKNHFTPKSEKSTELVTPKEEIIPCLKEMDELSPMASHRLKTKGVNESMISNERDRFFCKLCKFSTVKKTNLKLHEVRHRKKAPFQCKICSYSVEGNRQLAFHVTNHHQDGFPCSFCDFTAKTWNSKSRHEATVHKVSSLVKTAIVASEEPSDLDHDVEYACSHCSYKTPSRERFVAHEKTHLPDIVESSTEELSVESDSKATRVETSIKKLKRKREEPEESISSSGTVKLIERLVYQCPLCSYWARTVTNFHQHFIAHEKTPAFKCSKCDYSARYRSNVTKHIRNSSKKTHNSACWVLIKTVPENQYPEYLKTAHVPECSYSGKSLTPTNTISSSEKFVTKLSDSSENRSRTSSESFPEDSSDDESHDWIPSSPSNIKDIESSSPSFVNSPDAISEYEEKPSTLCSPTSESKSEQSSESSTCSTGGSSAPFTSGIVLRSSSKKNSSPRRKRLRIESNESGEENEQLPRTKMKALTASSAKNTERKNGILSIIDQKLEIKMKLKIPSSFPKGPFPVLDEALAKRRKDEQKISEMQQRINRMRAKLEKTKETDAVSQSELLKLRERKSVVIKQMTKLNGKKIEAELQVRTQQCRELKLSLDMYEPEQQLEETERNTEELSEIKKLVAELEVKLALITKEIANLQEENENLDRQLKDAEESRAGAAQLIEILQCELSEKESELTSFQEELTGTDARIAELVNNERKEITNLTEICKEELKKAYMRGLSEICDRERELLNALEQFVKGKSESPNIDENI